MAPSFGETNSVPSWAQWTGICCSVSGVVSGVLGWALSNRLPHIERVLRVTASSAVAIAGVVFHIWAVSLASRPESSVAATLPLSIIASALLLAAVLGFLSLSPRQLARLFMFTLRYLGPRGKCETHRFELQQAFDSLRHLVARNTDSAWLLPAPSVRIVTDPKHGEDYLELEIREWSNLVTGPCGDAGLIGSTQYLFITWHLPQPTDWTPDLLKKLSPILATLGTRTRDNGLFVHRVMLGPWLAMPRREWTHFQNEIWGPYFAAYCGDAEPNYRLYFCDIEALRTTVNRQPAYNLQGFLDVSLFSFDERLRTYVAEHGTVLPLPEEFPREEFQEYAALQFSELINNSADPTAKTFLALQAVQGTAAKGRGGTKSGDQAIRERRMAVRRIWDEARGMTDINGELKAQHRWLQFSEFDSH